MKRPLFSVLIILSQLCVACLQSSVAPAPTPVQSTSPTEVSAPGKCNEIGQTWTSPVDGTTLVCVPAGQFLMGAAEDDPLAGEDEKPQHEVYLDAFWIDRTEVTNVNFRKCVEAGACHPKEYDTSNLSYPVHPDYQQYPALVYESDPTSEYCQWVGRRLPTEAEWEKAARGTDARLYPWGNAELSCKLANYYECVVMTNASSTAPRCGETRHCSTARVDAYPDGASPYGALNMSGNVWEWVADWYQADYYAHSPKDNPKGPASGDYRVIRGGGTKSLSQDLRVTARASGKPEHYMDGQVGFRCALDAQNP